MNRVVKSVLIGIAIVVAALVALVVLVRFVIQPINPAQESPEKHFGGPCWACHLVTDSVPVKQPEGAANPQ